MKIELEQLSQLGLSAEGRAYVEAVLTNPPSRTTSSYRGSNIGRFASPARACSLQSEARHTEFAYLHTLEFDRSVVHVADQPEPLRVVKPAGSSRPVGPPRRADFLIIRKDFVELIECKTVSELKKLVSERPEWYFQDSAGVWHFRLMEAASRSLGIRYSIVTNEDINPVLCHNVSFLWPYYTTALEDLGTELIKAGNSALDQSPVITFDDLLAKVDNRPDVVYGLIAHGIAFVDLTRIDLTDGSELFVYRNQRTYDTVLVADRALSNGQAEKALPLVVQGFSSHDLKATVERYRRIEPYVLRNISPPKKLHFEYRYYRLFKKAEREGKAGIEGIVSCTSKRGWRGRRLPKHIFNALKVVFEELWELPVPITKTAFFGNVGNRFSVLGFSLPSRKTINAYLKRFHREKTDRKKNGWVAAYQNREYSRQDQPLELHGTRVLEIVHIDHKLLRVLIRCSRTNQLLGLCWLTLAVDAFSRMPVGFWLDFSRPNAVSLLMVLRDIVWRYGRLPTTLVTDNGAEFHSALYQLLIARYGVHALYRAPRHSSDGGVVERAFSTIDTELIHSLEGVVPKGYDLKKYDPFTDPRARADVNIDHLYRMLNHYLFNEYPYFNHADLGATPHTIWQTSLEETGLLNLPQIDRSTFYFDSLPFDARSPTRLVNTSSGINIRKRNYWTPAFRNPILERQPVNVRFDPVDPFFVYAQIGTDWHRCDVNHASRLKGLTRGTQYRNIEWRRRTALVEQARDLRAIAVASMHEKFKVDAAVAMHEPQRVAPTSAVTPPSFGGFSSINFNNLEANPKWKNR